MQRPDVALLNISYRRIPILAIGRDVYLDTRLMFSKLDFLFPPSDTHPGLNVATPEGVAICRLLSSLWNDGRTSFLRASQAILSSLPEADSSFIADRKELIGLKEEQQAWLDRDALLDERDDAVFELVGEISFLESTLLSDGRQWLLGTDSPSLADIEAAWALDWVLSVPGALPEDQVSKAKFPQAMAWLERLSHEIDTRGSNMVMPQSIDGPEAANVVLNARFAEAVAEIDDKDVDVSGKGFHKGDLVILYPNDYGSLHKDQGKLLGFNNSEVVIEVQASAGDLHLHAPRHGFTVQKV